MTETKIKEWEEHKKEMGKMRENRRKQFIQILPVFRKLGFVVREISPFQYRVNDILDIYPSNKRYHDLKTHVRGDIRGVSFNIFLRKFFNLAV